MPVLMKETGMPHISSGWLTQMIPRMPSTSIALKPFVASSSPFILDATLNKHLNQYNDHVAEDMKKNICVDDFIFGVQREEEAATYYNRARALMSESQIVLHWLWSTKELFVASRLREIKELMSLKNQKYCPISDNPADLLTRGISSQQFKSSDKWGNNALLIEETTSPTGTSTTNHVQGPGLDQLITVSNVSTLSKLLSVTANVLRFVEKLQMEARKQKP